MIGRKPKKTALVYFSLNGNTDYVANRIAEEIGNQADLDVIRLEPKKPYVDKEPMKFVKGGAAATFGAKPELKAYDFEPKEYDTIIFGTPVWAGTFAPPLRTFMLAHKLKGKNIALFINSSSGNVDKCLAKLDKYLKKTNLIATLSLVDPLRSMSTEDLEEIRKFAREILENKE
ncbi:flavodoxin family protein [Aminicella lysinilytica]|uniref:Flavodoxin n=1 Tax=Aminicella lysinilytica TaxID=433323 RepID=A0A4R6Q2D0_9FIRM|nr:flavodoxin [Aminicella lysinilytica]TDP54573.1 flavodoxin [Aminicella lysinilytica]